MSGRTRAGFRNPVSVEALPGRVGVSVGAVPNETHERLPQWVVPAMLAVADIAAFFVAFAGPLIVIGPSGQHGALAVLGVCLLPIWLLGMRVAGLYDRDNRLIHHSTIDEISDLGRVAALCTFIVLVATSLMEPAVARVGAALVFWVMAMVALVVFRAIARYPIYHDPRFRQNTVIVGAGSVGQLLGIRILQNPECRLNLLGFVDRMPKERRPDLDDLTVLGGTDDLSHLVADLGVDRVIVAFSNDSSEETTEVIRLLHDSRVTVDIVPRLFDVIPPGATSHALAGIPLISVPGLRLSFSVRLVKRTFDLVVSIALLVMLVPAFAIIAVLSKRDSRGPVFFKQLRMGANDKPFFILKFRTMAIDADTRKQEIAHLNRHARPGGDARMFKVVNDPRVTSFGRFLRRYSLDELPQLINVVRGEMSMVGPRPLILDEDTYVTEWGRTRLALKPGITGLWQISGRNEIPFEEMVKLDYLYVTSWSLGNDCRLMLKTLPIIRRGDSH
jgi:exopolysaccharide biosynthesis polyprenyl glycosylphosphotransferase